MNKRQIFIVVIAAVLVALYGFLTWYQQKYSMAAAEQAEAGDATAKQRVLIAAQGSAFKNKVVADVLEQLKKRSVYAQVVDVSSLPHMRDTEWTAIVVIHTWEYWKPQPDAAAFVARVTDKNKLLAIATSGSGKEKLEIAGVDAISAASKMSDAPALAERINQWLDAKLQN